MQSRLRAPWAESIVDDGPLTIADLERLPDDGWLYELVEGRLVRMAPEGGEASYLGIRLASAIQRLADEIGGFVTGAAGGFELSRPGEPPTVLAPDVAFVRAERVPPPGSRERRGFWRLAPDLVVEIASPSQRRPDLEAKVRVYLAAGVRLVWVVWPRRQEIDVWPAGAEAPVRTLRLGDVLDGGDVLPGFRLPLDRLFA